MRACVCVCVRESLERGSFFFLGGGREREREREKNKGANNSQLFLSPRSLRLSLENKIKTHDAGIRLPLRLRPRPRRLPLGLHDRRGRVRLRGRAHLAGLPLEHAQLPGSRLRLRLHEIRVGGGAGSLRRDERQDAVREGGGVGEGDGADWEIGREGQRGGGGVALAPFFFLLLSISPTPLFCSPRPLFIFDK